MVSMQSIGIGYTHRIKQNDPLMLSFYSKNHQTNNFGNILHYPQHTSTPFISTVAAEYAPGMATAIIINTCPVSRSISFRTQLQLVFLSDLKKLDTP